MNIQFCILIKSDFLFYLPVKILSFIIYYEMNIITIRRGRFINKIIKGVDRQRVENSDLNFLRF